MTRRSSWALFWTLRITDASFSEAKPGTAPVRAELLLDLGQDWRHASPMLDGLSAHEVISSAGVAVLPRNEARRVVRSMFTLM